MAVIIEVVIYFDKYITFNRVDIPKKSPLRSCIYCNKREKLFYKPDKTRLESLLNDFKNDVQYRSNHITT